MRCNGFHNTTAKIEVRMALLHKAASIVLGNKPKSMAKPDTNNDIPKNIKIKVPNPNSAISAISAAIPTAISTSGKFSTNQDILISLCINLINDRSFGALLLWYGWD